MSLKGLDSSFEIMYMYTGCYLLGEGVGGKVLPQTSHLPPQKFKKNYSKCCENIHGTCRPNAQ